jgi:hypothetical protein
MNALTQMVPGDPDCDACIVARQFIRTEDHCRVLMASNAGLTSEMLRLRERLEQIVAWLRAQANSEHRPKIQMAFVEAHNAALAIKEGRADDGGSNDSRR